MTIFQVKNCAAIHNVPPCKKGAPHIIYKKYVKLFKKYKI